MSQVQNLTGPTNPLIPAIDFIAGNDAVNVPPNAGHINNVIGNNTQGINVTGNAGTSTSTITAFNATTAQIGVTSLATNAETVTGAVTTKATTPDDIKAKLGAQTLNAIAYGAGQTNALNWTAAGTNGQIPIGSTGNPPVMATITSTDGSVTITNSAGGIDLSASGIPPTPSIDFIAGNDAVNVPPNAGHINNVIGDNTQGINVTGNAGTNTSTITAFNATTAQIGVTSLATNAETVTGAVTTKATTPDDIKAKLGAQTLNALAYGGGQTNAVNWLAAATNGQIPIGSTGNPPVLANITSIDSTVTITNSAGGIDLSSTGMPPTPTTYTENTGTATPAANILNILGIGETTTSGTGNTVNILEPRTAKFIVDPTLYFGTHQTIGSALTAASSGQDIFIRPGTYTENITLKAGVNLVGYTGDGDSQQVIILGTCTALFAGTCCISNIQLKTNNAPFLTVSGSSATIIDLIGCVLNASNNTGISFTSSSSSAKINGKYCQGLIGTTGLAFFVSSSAGNMNFAYSNLGNSGDSTVASSTSGGSVGFDHCLVFFPVSSSSTGGINGNYTEFSTSSINTESITHNGTTSGSLAYCKISSNTADCMTVGSGAAMIIRSSSFSTTNTNSIVGGGSLTYSGVTLPSGGVVTVTTQTPNISLRDACTVTSPGAYPYTTVPQDYLITVNTTSARTIVPLANPTKGQIHIIKDNSGIASLNNITVTPSGKNIDGAASYTINNNYGSITLIYNGTQWDVV